MARDPSPFKGSLEELLLASASPPLATNAVKHRGTGLQDGHQTLHLVCYHYLGKWYRVYFCFFFSHARKENFKGTCYCQMETLSLSQETNLKENWGRDDFLLLWFNTVMVYFLTSHVQHMFRNAALSPKSRLWALVTHKPAKRVLPQSSFQAQEQAQVA